MYQNRLDTIVDIIKLQNNRLNNNVIETKPTILLKHKKIFPESKEKSYDIVKSKNDLVL